MSKPANLPPFGRRSALGRFLYLVGRGFVDNRCASRAAALAYTLLLALVPLLVVMLSVSKNFLHDQSADLVPKLIDRMITMVAPELEFMPDQEQSSATPAAKGHVTVSSKARQEAVEKIQSFINNINAGALGTVGTILLIVVAIRLLMTIEDSFNEIWGVTKGRSIWQKIIYYWAAITLGPLLLLGAIVTTGTMEVTRVVGKFAVFPVVEKMLLFMAPFAVLWIGFGLMYALMPNTRVRPGAAILGGVVAGTLWQLNSLLSTLYVSRVVSASKVYGSLGIIPVFLAGLYLAWVIVLLGVQVSVVAQTFRKDGECKTGDEVDEEGRELIACRIVLVACQRFLAAQPAPGMEELARQLGVPMPLFSRLADRLAEGGVLAMVAKDGSVLVPARSPEQITVAEVLHIVRSAGDAPRAANGDVAAAALKELYRIEHASPSNARFSELAAKAKTTT